MVTIANRDGASLVEGASTLSGRQGVPTRHLACSAANIFDSAWEFDHSTSVTGNPTAIGNETKCSLARQSG